MLNESQLINNAVITHNYEVEALASFAARGDDMMEELTERFGSEFTDYDASEDIGGLVLYRRAGALVAFYDYEQFRGAVLTSASSVV
jgi:Mg2+/Co2+ transporter CorC